MASCWRPLLAAVALLLRRAVAASEGEADGGRPVLDVFFYRAMPSESVNNWNIENMDMASVGGVTKYVHTEVLAESIIGSPERERRKYGIQVIAKYPMKVKNPSSVTARSSHINTQVHFGPFVTFDYGVATNPQTQTMIKEHGAFVGVQGQYDPRWPHSMPYFWFSVTGWCPNIVWSDRPATREEAERIISDRSGLCSHLDGSIACEQNLDACVYENGTCIARDPVPMCLNYTSPNGQNGHVLGGLCPGGHQKLVEPTGEHGCTYSYGKAESVTLDEVVGILDEDCGNRTCTGWLDFRHNCSNSEYRQKFNWQTKKKEPFKYCVEYDISPPCQADCWNSECREVPEFEKEIGLPFWQGRCQDHANLARATKVAALFPVAQSGKDIESTRSDSCVFQTPGSCTPVPGQGGNYCTRRWAGICVNCFVPGTQATWPADYMAYCPYDILKSLDYETSPRPTCASSNPRDLCCLYTAECSLKGSDPAEAPLDEDGFAWVASFGNSSLMAAFLERAVQSRGWGSYAERLMDFARTETGWSPRKGASLESTLDMMSELNITVGRTTSITSTATSTTSRTATTSTSRTATTTTSRTATTTTSSTATITSAGETTTTTSRAPSFLDVRTGGEHEASRTNAHPSGTHAYQSGASNPTASMDIDTVVSVGDETQASSLLSILITIDIFGGALSIGSLLAGAVLLRRHLGAWPLEPQARADAWELVQAAVGLRRAAYI